MKALNPVIKVGDQLRIKAPDAVHVVLITTCDRLRDVSFAVISSTKYNPGTFINLPYTHNNPLKLMEFMKREKWVWELNQ